MQRILSYSITLLAFFAVITQLVLTIKNTQLAVSEATIRFFSYFTILTNTMVALFFLCRSLHVKTAFRKGYATAVTSYILVVGIVYQLMLRHLSSPKGLHLIADELLHAVVPLLVALYWFLYERKKTHEYAQIKTWLIYPAIYYIYTLIRGEISGYYPYPFVDVTQIGYTKAVINGTLIILFMILIQAAFIKIAKHNTKK